MSSVQEVPPGYDPVTEQKPKSKSAKRNERKKEKRQQVNLVTKIVSFPPQLSWFELLQ